MSSANRSWMQSKTAPDAIHDRCLGPDARWQELTMARDATTDALLPELRPY
jgi:hypothetical protein